MRNCCAILAAALLATACTEKLDSGRACPGLCPIEQVGIADTTIQGVVVDSTIFAGPQVGSEGVLLLAKRTDGQIDLRSVIRFDSLPDTFIRSGATTGTAADTIKSLASVELIVVGDSVAPELLPDSDFTIGVYDVDTTGVPDTAVAPVAALFTPSRLLARQTFKADVAGDTMRFALPADRLLPLFQAGGRLRLGLQLESAGNTTIRLSSNTGGSAPTLHLRPSATADTAQADTASKRYWYPRSKSPEDDIAVQRMLDDYTLVVKGTPPPPPGVFAVGGIPGRRTYLAFDVPKRLLDSTQIVRATLRLTQLAVPVTDPRDTATLEVLLGTSRAVVTDIAKRVLFHEPLGYHNPLTLGDSGYYYGAIAGLTQLRLKSDTTATRIIEIAPILRRWSGVNAAEVPHTVILQVPTEGVELAELWFASLEASNPALRPSLQITFVPRNAPGIP